jgi:hypothetical protein
MSNDWVKIYTSQDFYKSEMVKQILIENEIEAVILNKKGYPYQIGEVEVHIRQQEFEKAIEIIIASGL